MYIYLKKDTGLQEALATKGKAAKGFRTYLGSHCVYEESSLPYVFVNPNRPELVIEDELLARFFDHARSVERINGSLPGHYSFGEAEANIKSGMIELTTRSLEGLRDMKILRQMIKEGKATADPAKEKKNIIGNIISFFI